MYTDTVIVGAGQAGLALSRHLTEQGCDHVVLERARIGARWHDERWDSLTLLSPNWLNRLPGAPEPTDPGGFMSRTAFAELLEGYAASFSAPVLDGTEVERVAPAGRGFRVETSGGVWTAANVVVATGDSDVPRVPPQAHHLPAGVASLQVRDYKSPGALGEGGRWRRKAYRSPAGCSGSPGPRVLLADDLPATAREADARMFRVLAEIDSHIERNRLDMPETAVRPLALRDAPAAIDLAGRGIRTVIWATGYRRDYRWLDVPGARSRDGELIQHRGSTPVPGLYVLGLRFQQRRNSHFIGGVGRDAAEVAAAIAARRPARLVPASG